MKRIISEKIKKIDDKINQNKSQRDLDKQTTKFSALASGNINKYEFLMSKGILPERDLLEKSATRKRFE